MTDEEYSEVGLTFIFQTDSHAKFRKIDNLTKTVIIKMSKKEISHGTFRSILLHNGLKEEDFRRKKNKN